MASPIRSSSSAGSPPGPVALDAQTPVVHHEVAGSKRGRRRPLDAKHEPSSFAAASALCRGLACHVRDALTLLDRMRESAGARAGRGSAHRSPAVRSIALMVVHARLATAPVPPTRSSCRREEERHRVESPKVLAHDPLRRGELEPRRAASSAASRPMGPRRRPRAGRSSPWPQVPSPPRQSRGSDRTVEERDLDPARDLVRNGRRPRLRWKRSTTRDSRGRALSPTVEPTKSSRCGSDLRRVRDGRARLGSTSTGT
jgi:hypothetical protein